MPTHVHTQMQKKKKSKSDKKLHMSIVPKHTTTSRIHIHTHTDSIYSHPEAGSVNTHIDHLLIYRSSKYCKQWHGFFCFHKIHTQFIHLLEANQCGSLGVEHISLTYSIKKTDRAVIQAYFKAG